MLALTLRTHDFMIFRGMNGKLPSKNSVWKLISCAEGGNDEMGIPNSHERSRLNKMVNSIEEHDKVNYLS